MMATRGKPHRHSVMIGGEIVLGKQVKKSVTRIIAKSMLLILLLSIVTTGFAILTLASSLNDAEAVNVAGSMRMQSYRLAHDIQSHSTDYRMHIEDFEHSLYSSSMQGLQHWSVPVEITQDYSQLVARWKGLRAILKSANNLAYLDEVEGFVGEIDQFVFKLQQFSEQKLIKLAWVGGIGLGGVLFISLFVIHYIQKEVVRPLRALVQASEQIQNRSFNIQLETSSPNEMGILMRTFNGMAGELGKLYHGLEQAVNEKTHKLQHANQSLQVLYHSLQELTASRISLDNFQAILRNMVSIEGVHAVQLLIEEEAGKGVVLCEGQFVGESSCQQPLILDGQHLGELYWQEGQPTPDVALMDNFVHILSRAVYYNWAQKQAEQLLLMEERTTIARELHDSLAQSLSYLKIQVSLLKRVINKLDQGSKTQQATTILNDIDQGLSGAYTQLRELLTTFRLTIKEGTFGQALQEMIRQLDEQTEAQIVLNNQLSSLELDAHQQVHLMQLMREAVINAMKHAQASEIHVDCYEDEEHVVVTIEDNGCGFDVPQMKQNHYGMSIMQERAARLNGELFIEAAPASGCKITLKYPCAKDR